MRRLSIAGVLILAFICALDALAEDASMRLEALGVELERNEQGAAIAVDFGWNDSLCTAADLKLLAALTELEEVTVSGVNLGSDGLKPFTQLKNLRRLYASETKSTDIDIQHLADLKSLEEIDLSDTAVTDKCIEVLLGIPSLRSVNLSHTRTTSAGISRLRSQRPDIKVEEYWRYFAGYFGGHAVLDLDRATIFFDGYSTGSGSSAGGGGGSEILVSEGGEDFDESSGSVGGFGFSFGGNAFQGGAFSAQVSRENGRPVLKAGKHRIVIEDNGARIVIDGQSFPIGQEKLRLEVHKDGTISPWAPR